MSGVIALTGVTGFIGGALAHRFREARRQIRALVRPGANRTHLNGMDIHWVEGDLHDFESLRRLVLGVDAVIHCAGAVRSATRDYFMSVNRDGAGRLVQAATEQQQPPRFFLISSLAAREPHLSPYAESKKKGEEILAAKAGGMPWAVLRPPAVYGPGDQELRPLFRWMFKGIGPVLGPPHARFSILYVEDLAEAVEQWLRHGSNGRHIFELHDGQPNGYAWEDLLQTMARLRGGPVHRIPVPPALLGLVATLNVTAARLTGLSPMLSPGKVRELRHPNWVCDNTLLNRETGWTPRVQLKEGLLRTLKSLHIKNPRLRTEKRKGSPG